MNTGCTCGALDVEDDDLTEIGLANDAVVRVARRAGRDPNEVTRLLYLIALAPPEDCDRVIAWLRREQMRAMRRAKAKSDAKTAAIEAARRRAER